MTSTIFAACAVLSFASPTEAQNPSADQIIRSLEPSGVTRGIRPVGPPSGTSVPSLGATSASTVQGSAAPTVARPVPPPSVNLTIQFPTGSAVVTPEAARSLDELGRALTNNALSGYRFRIEGHTDTVGTREYNKLLSEKRAASVLDYLVRKWGVDPAKVQPVGMGLDQPLVPTGPNVAEARNRRVTVVNLGT
jgi:outer membrane protein OmpA-like peptidoglycan-associated protein